MPASSSLLALFSTRVDFNQQRDESRMWSPSPRVSQINFSPPEPPDLLNCPGRFAYNAMCRRNPLPPSTPFWRIDPLCRFFLLSKAWPFGLFLPLSTREHLVAFISTPPNIQGPRLGLSCSSPPKSVPFCRIRFGPEFLTSRL